MDDNVLDVTFNNVEVELEAEDTVQIDNSGAGKSPYIGENGNWYEYDDQNKVFVDTGIQAEGPEGPEGPAGPAGSDYVLTNQDKQDIAGIVGSEAVKYVSQQLTDAQKIQARENIGAASLADLGTVFTLKGGVATVQDLPQSGNRIGDVYYVENLSAGFIWITSTAYPNGYWEELGETVDLSNYIEKPSAPTSGQILQWNGTAWVAGTIQTDTPRIVATSAAAALDPNKFYVFPEMSALSVTLAPPESSDIVNEYHFRFTSGSAATVLTLPNGVVEPDDFSVEANKVYEISIVDNYMLAVSWSVSA